MFGRPQQQQQYPTRQNYQTADMPVGAGQHAAIASPRMHASPNTLQVNPNPMTSTSGLLSTLVLFLGYGLILNQPSTDLFIVLITHLGKILKFALHISMHFVKKKRKKKTITASNLYKLIWSDNKTYSML